MRQALGLLIVLSCFACDFDRQAPPPQGDEPGGTAAAPTAYERRLLFVGGRAAAPTAAVFDFLIVDHGSRVERTAYSWFSNTGRWLPLLNASWAQASMREPFRLVPYGPLRMVVGDSGELEAIVYRDDEVRARLTPGSGIALWSPRSGEQLSVRDAALALGTDPVEGTLLDLQTERAAGDTAQRAVALITDGGGLRVVVSNADTGGAVWLREGAAETTWEGPRLTAVIDSAGTQPTIWRLASQDGSLRLELRASAGATPRASGAVGAPATTAAGWVEVRGRRTRVFALVRSGEE